MIRVRSCEGFTLCGITYMLEGKFSLFVLSELVGIPKNS